MIGSAVRMNFLVARVVPLETRKQRQRRGPLEIEEAFPSGFGPEIGVAEFSTALEMVLGEVVSKRLQRGAKIVLHFAKRAQAVKRLHPGRKRLDEDGHYKQGQRHRDEQ